jgi:hypothetical protein
MAYTEYLSLHATNLSNDWEINLSVFKSKPYCKMIELSKDKEKKEDIRIYIGYIGNL